MGSKLCVYNKSGNVVLWFKGVPILSESTNSLQTAKTEHWLGASAGKRIIDQYVTNKVVVAGTLASGYKSILEKSINNADQYFTVDKLQTAGLTSIGSQYAHFGGRSGNLEPLAALGLNPPIYFEEKGSGQSGRDLHIGADNKIRKVIIKAVTSSSGVISEGLAWIDGQTGNYRIGKPEYADGNQQAYFDKLINRWMGLTETDPVSAITRSKFYNAFLSGQDKNKKMLENSARFKSNLDPTYTPEQHEEQVLSDSDLNKIKKGLP